MVRHATALSLCKLTRPAAYLPGRQVQLLGSGSHGLFVIAPLSYPGHHAAQAYHDNPKASPYLAFPRPNLQLGLPFFPPRPVACSHHGLLSCSQLEALLGHAFLLKAPNPCPLTHSTKPKIF
ncbi:hypothetical protein ACFX1R_003341 [Malus domestica]